MPMQPSCSQYTAFLQRPGTCKDAATVRTTPSPRPKPARTASQLPANFPLGFAPENGPHQVSSFLWQTQEKALFRGTWWGPFSRAKQSGKLPQLPFAGCSGSSHFTRKNTVSRSGILPNMSPMQFALQMASPHVPVYCACHAKGKCGGSMYCACPAKGSRGPAAATAPQLRQEALCTAPATHKGSAEALCTAPARQKAAAGQRRPPRRSSARKPCVLRLPRQRQPGSYLYSE